MIFYYLLSIDGDADKLVREVRGHQDFLLFLESSNLHPGQVVTDPGFLVHLGRGVAGGVSGTFVPLSDLLQGLLAVLLHSPGHGSLLGSLQVEGLDILNKEI